MSMNAIFRHVSPLGVAALRRDPDLVEAVIEAEAEPSPPLPVLRNVRPGAIESVAGIMDNLHSRLATLPREQQAVARQMLDNWASNNDQLLGRVAAGAPIGGGPTDLPYDLGTAPILDIEKAWHGLHYLLTGSADEAPGPAGMVIMGGREIGEDLGYGPLRALDAPDVARVSEALATIAPAALAARLDARAMDAAGIYPGGWDDPEAAEWLTGAFVQVRDFYAEAAATGHAMLLYLL